MNTNELVTVPTVVKVEPPLGRSENVATWLWAVVGQFDVASFTHVYVPRNVTMSLYWTVETDGAWRAKPKVAAATPAGPASAAASAATCAATASFESLRPRIKPFLRVRVSIERTLCGHWAPGA